MPCQVNPGVVTTAKHAKLPLHWKPSTESNPAWMALSYNRVSDEHCDVRKEDRDA